MAIKLALCVMSYTPRKCRSDERCYMCSLSVRLIAYSLSGVECFGYDGNGDDQAINMWWSADTFANTLLQMPTNSRYVLTAQCSYLDEINNGNHHQIQQHFYVTWMTNFSCHHFFPIDFGVESKNRISSSTKNQAFRIQICMASNRKWWMNTHMHLN